MKPLQIKYLHGSIYFNSSSLLGCSHTNENIPAIYAECIADKVSAGTPFQRDDFYIIRDGKALQPSDVLFDKYDLEQLSLGRNKFILQKKEEIGDGGCSRCSINKVAPSMPFVLLKPSVSRLVPLVFQLPSVKELERSSNSISLCKHVYTETQYFPANMKIFQLKRSLFTSKTTSIKPQSFTIVINGKLAHDNTMIGDYFFKKCAWNVKKKTERTWAHDSILRSLQFSPLSVQVLQTANLKHDVDVIIALRNNQTLKFSMEISKPILSIRQFLFQHLRIPIQIPLVISLELNSKKVIDLHPDYSFIDYGVTANDKSVNVSLARLESDSKYKPPLPWDALSHFQEPASCSLNQTGGGINSSSSSFNDVYESLSGTLSGVLNSSAGGDIRTSDLETLLTSFASGGGANGQKLSRNLLSALSDLKSSIDSTCCSSSGSGSGSSCKNTQSSTSGVINADLNIYSRSSSGNTISNNISISNNNAAKRSSTSRKDSGFFSGFKKGFLLSGGKVSSPPSVTNQSKILKTSASPEICSKLTASSMSAADKENNVDTENEAKIMDLSLQEK